MLVSILSDCVGDENGRSRFEAAVVAEIPDGRPVPCYCADDLEAGCNLIDHIRRARGNPAIMLVNVAPRRDFNGSSRQNGSDFCYLWVAEQRILVASTIEGQSLTMLAKLFGENGRLQVNKLDLRAAAKKLFPQDPMEASFAANSQFRGVDFLVPAASAIWRGQQLPTEAVTYEQSIHHKGWMVDKFGNVKTTYLWDTTKPLPPTILYTLFSGPDQFEGTESGEIRVVPRLCDIPSYETAVTIGSSGFEKHRFLEIATKMGRADIALTPSNWRIVRGTGIQFHNLEI